MNATKVKHTPMITLSKGGTKERTVKLETLHIPDAWGFAFELKKTDVKSGQAIDELWHVAHDLKRHALEQAQVQAGLLEALQRLAEKVKRANDIQHSGGAIQAEDWSELYQLTNEAFSAITKAHAGGE